MENRLNPDGTATLAGHCLPPDEVAAVCDRLDALALRVKNASASYMPTSPRRVTAAPGASWFYAVVRPDGTPINVGPIRRRPTMPCHDGPAPTYDRVEVWLHLTPDDLAVLAAHPPPGWEQVITDLVYRIAQTTDGAPNGNPTDRLPGSMLRRWLGVRDRRCAFPGCRIAPHRCDIDHTVEHHKGGPTIDTNLGPCCRPDHRLRHEHGWTVEQIHPGHFIWTSPSGHQYVRLPPPGPEHALQPMPV